MSLRKALLAPVCTVIVVTVNFLPHMTLKESSSLKEKAETGRARRKEWVQVQEDEDEDHETGWMKEKEEEEKDA